MAKDLFDELNPDQIKDEIWQTRFPPVETTRIIVTESAIESTGSGAGLTQDEMELPVWMPIPPATTEE